MQTLAQVNYNNLKGKSNLTDGIFSPFQGHNLGHNCAAMSEDRTELRGRGERKKNKEIKKEKEKTYTSQPWMKHMCEKWKDCECQFNSSSATNKGQSRGTNLIQTSDLTVPL